MAFAPKAFKMSDISAEKPVLPTGLYAGYISYASTEKKSGDDFVPTIGVFEDIKYEDNAPVGQGTFSLTGTLSWRVVLESKKAKKLLNTDNPTFFGSAKLVFDQETGEFVFNNNPIIRQILDLMEFDDEKFQEEILDVIAEGDQDAWENPEVPDALSSIPNAETLVGAAAYYRKMLELICKNFKGTKVRASIVKKHPNIPGTFKENKKEWVNALDQGDMRPFSSCGMVKYEENSEFDDE